MKELYKIYTSKDYSKFEFPDFKVSKKHLDAVKDSIRFKNLMKDHPILVDDNFKIIEGRYRFLACYDLQCEFSYKVAEVTNLKDAIRIKNIHKNSTYSDVINAYSDLEQYNKILLLHQEIDEKVSLGTIVRCIDEVSRGVLVDRKLFDSGNLPVWNYVKCRNKVNEIIKFVDAYGDYGASESDYFKIIAHLWSFGLFSDIVKKAFMNAEKYMDIYNKQYPNRLNRMNSIRESVIAQLFEVWRIKAEKIRGEKNDWKVISLIYP